MTRDEALELLRGGQDGVAEWNQRRQAGDVPVSPRGILQPTDLTGVDLAGVDLTGALLNNTDFRDADLTGAILRRADVTTSSFHGSASLRETDFTEANMQCSVLMGAQLERAKLVKANLGKANLTSANLSYADLTYATLSRAILAHARCRNAILRNVDFEEVCLERTDLSCADVSGANISGANLKRASLSGADLKRASLSGADLSGANLSGTDLSGAVVGSTKLGDVDLSVVCIDSLRAVRHLGPSTIGTDTLAKSKGRIPPEFLRGCGLSDWEVEAARLYDPELSPGQVADIQQRVFDLRAGAVIQLYSVFMSHSHANKAFAKALHDALQAKGVRCWLDEKQIKPGDDLQDAIAHGIKHWDKLILCCSEAALERSWWVEDEIDRTLDKERELRKHHGAEERLIIPIDLDGHVFNWSNSRAKILTRRKVADFSDWKPGAQLPEERLLELLEALQVGRGKGEPKSFLPDLP